MDRSEIILHPRSREGGQIVLGAELRSPSGSRVLWFRVPEKYESWLTEWADPFVIGFTFPMMKGGLPVVVRGRVSPSLLKSLEDFMLIWQAWFPKLHRFVPVTADAEVEPAPARGPAVMMFSGGLDSCYSAWAHHAKMAGRRAREISAGLYVRGLDIPLADEGSFLALCANNTRVLSSLGMELVPLATNFREMEVDYENAHATALVSCMALFGKKFEAGILAASAPYTAEVPRWGSNFVTDRCLSSSAFPVIYDSAEVSRVRKAAELVNWPEAMRHLHVCWQGAVRHENCCECEKCIHTILEFRVNGSPRPPGFSKDVTDAQIRRVRLKSRGTAFSFALILSEARKKGWAKESWVRAVETPLRRFRWRQWLESGRRLFALVSD